MADFLRQVGYREYSRYLSFHFPFTHERSLLEHLRAVPWKFDQRLFKVRCAWGGETGEGTGGGAPGLGVVPAGTCWLMSALCCGF